MNNLNTRIILTNQYLFVFLTFIHHQFQPFTSANFPADNNNLIIIKRNGLCRVIIGCSRSKGPRNQKHNSLRIVAYIWLTGGPSGCT